MRQRGRGTLRLSERGAAPVRGGRKLFARPSLPLLAAALVFAALLAAVWGQQLPRQPSEPYNVHAEKLRDPAAADPARMTEARVSRVVDGDTVVVDIPMPPVGLEGRETVRLIGVDAPELARGGKAEESGGSRARLEARRLLEDRAVLLAFDRDLRDRYGRVLAYLYSTDGVCLNLLLVDSGATRALLKYPFAFSAAFAEAERRARDALAGSWAPGE